MRKTNAIIASFVMLDFNGDLDIDMNEFQYLVSCSVLIDKNKLFDAFDKNQNEALDIYEFVTCLLKQSFRTKIMSETSNITQLKCNAWMECNIFRHRNYSLYIFVFIMSPVIGLSVIQGLSHRFKEELLNYLIGAFFIINMIEIHCRWFCFGIQRFWDLLKYPNPNYIIAAINKYKASGGGVGGKYHSTKNIDDTVSTIRLTSNERNWVSNHLREIRPLSILEKSTQSLINRIEISVFWFCAASWIILQILFMAHSTKGDDTDKQYNGVPAIQINNRYQLYFLQFAMLIRIFTLIPANQKLIYVVFKVFPEFIALFAFLGLYIYFWARIGCTLFGDNKTDIVLPEIYEPAEDMVARFDSLSYAILALIQLMIGEGWHEVMYFNIIATTQFNSLYFIIYITIVSIIIANVFVGLFLADIDELTQEQSHDEIIQQSTKSKSFPSYATKKLNKLYYQIQANQQQNHLMMKQIQHINHLLQQQQFMRQYSNYTL